MNQNRDIAHHPGEKRKDKHASRHPLIDKEKGLVYEDKQWKPLSELTPAYIDELTEGEAPSTTMEKGKLADGVLHLSGEFLREHKEEILNTVKNMSEHAKESDPLNYVENIEELEPDKITVYTIKNQLAVRIGKKISESFKGGELKIHWSKDDKPVELWWHKDNK